MSDSPVFHGVGLGEPLDNLGDGGPLLSDGHINAVQLLLLISGVVEPKLIIPNDYLDLTHTTQFSTSSG